MLKRLNRSVAFISVVMLLLIGCMIPVGAINTKSAEQETLYFEDGSYLTIETVMYDPVATRGTPTVSGKKTATYSDASENTLWTITINGVFTYNGSSATATNASYSYKIYSSSWSLKSADAYCSGNKAIAEGVFSSGFLLNRNVTVTLTCSPDGELS